MEIKLVIDRVEEGRAIFKTEFNDTLELPDRLIPPNAKAGDILHLELLTEEESALKKARGAKDILNELLQTTEI
jgi:hypothetical protein